MAQANGNGSKLLTKEQLLAKMRERRETYELPGGGQIVLRSLDMEQGVDHFGATGGDSRAVADRSKKICLLGIVEPRLDLEDLEALEHARFGAVNQIAMKVLELTGMVGKEASSFLTPIPA